MAINRRVDIEGNATTYVPIQGVISSGASIRGNVTVQNKSYRELYFAPHDQFPVEGKSDVLYVDTELNKLYFWASSHYVAIAGVSIDDTQILNDATWSSNKINTEIDGVRTTPISNMEILEILSK